MSQNEPACATKTQPGTDCQVKAGPSRFGHLAIFVPLDAETNTGMTKADTIDWLRRAKAAFDGIARSKIRRPWVSVAAWRDSVRQCDLAIAELEKGSWFREHGWVDPDKPEYLIRSYSGPGQQVSWEVHQLADFFFKVAE